MASNTLKPFAFFAPQRLAATDDLNSITTAGAYYVKDYTIPAHSPASDAYNSLIIVFRFGTSLVIQLWLSVNKRAVYMRTATADNNFGNWGQFTITNV
jgi:hypothetical protein